MVLEVAHIGGEDRPSDRGEREPLTTDVRYITQAHRVPGPNDATWARNRPPHGGLAISQRVA